MKGKIDGVVPDRNGRDVVKIKTLTGIKSLYGLSPAEAVKGTDVEYELVTSQSGFPYARFIRYIIGNDNNNINWELTEDSAGRVKSGTAEDDAGQVQPQTAEDVTGQVLSGTAENNGGQNFGQHMVKENDGGDIRYQAAGSDQYLTVTRLNSLIKLKIRNIPVFQDFWVKGEVTNYSGHSRHYYFGIKDENSLVSCILWESVAPLALDFTLEKGQQIVVRGTLEFSEKSGKCNIIVSKIINLGEGDAKLRLLQLREQLRAEGLFDIGHHKEIPRHAKRVGIVTSQYGQAIKDICKVARERNPYVQLVLFHVNVQGIRAVDTTIEGIRRLDREGLDVIIVGRGGGSDEELLVYDDERLVRTVYAAATPIVSAVGHEGHTPMVDDVADARFATPTDAAQHVIYDVMSEIRHVDELLRQIAEKNEFNIRQRKMRLEKLKIELEKNSPMSQLKERMNRLTVITQRMRSRMDQIYNEKMKRFEVLTARLNGLSPTAKLVRGFGYISSDDRPVTGVDDVKVGDSIMIKIHDGEIGAKVTDINKISMDLFEETENDDEEDR